MHVLGCFMLGKWFFLFAALVGFIFCNCSLSAYLTGLKMGKTRGFYSFGAYWIQTVCLWPCSTSFCCHIQVFTMSSGYYPNYLFCNSFSTTTHPLPQIRCIIEIRTFKIQPMEDVIWILRVFFCQPFSLNLLLTLNVALLKFSSIIVGWFF